MGVPLVRVRRTESCSVWVQSGSVTAVGMPLVMMRAVARREALAISLTAWQRDPSVSIILALAPPPKERLLHRTADARLFMKAPSCDPVFIFGLVQK